MTTLKPDTMPRSARTELLIENRGVATDEAERLPATVPASLPPAQERDLVTRIERRYRLSARSWGGLNE